MNKATQILMITLTLFINYFAITYEKEVEAKEVELVHMSESLAYVFAEGVATADRLNKCRKGKK